MTDLYLPDAEIVVPEDPNWRKLLQDDEKESSFLRPDLERAESRLVPFTPFAPDERMKALKEINFHPHGYFVPDNPVLRAQIKTVLEKIGAIPNEQVDLRLRKYYDFQARTEQIYLRGEPGHWIGQQAVVRSPARFRLVAWARRGGKSTEAAAEAVAYATARPRSVIWLAAPIMDLVARSFDIVVRMLTDLNIKTVVHRDSAQNKLVVLENGSRIEGVSLENPPSVAGAAVDLAVVDEAAQIDSRAWYRAILPPLMDRNGQALLISSFEGAEGFFYEKSREASEGTWEIFTGASYDINFFNFPQGAKTKALVDAQREMPKLEFLEQFGAIPMGIRDRVWPEFRTRVHTGRFNFDPSMPVILSADPSGGGSPYAVVAIQDYGEWLKIIDEYYQPYVTTEHVAGVLDQRPWRENVTTMLSDPAHPDEAVRWTRLGYPCIGMFEKPEIVNRLPLHRNALRDPGRFAALERVLINQILEQMGEDVDADLDMSSDDQYALHLQVEEAISDDKLTPEMIEALRKCCRIYINAETCPNTIMEHQKYRYMKPRKTWMNLKDKPADAFNHCFVAGTPVMTDRGLQPIERIRVGNRVLTRQGFKRVTAAGMTDPAAPVVKVSFSNGRALIATAEHPVWVHGKGWVRILDVQEKDWIYCLPSWVPLKPLNSKDVHTAGIRSRLGLRIAAILSAANTTFTETCGSLFMGRYRPAMLSTTPTGTMTTPRSLWKPSRHIEPICENTGDQLPQNEPIQIVFDRWLQSGTGQNPATNGMWRMEPEPSVLSRCCSGCVQGAVESTKHEPTAETYSSALGHVRLPRDERPGWMTKIASVLGAVRRFVLGNTYDQFVVPAHAVRVTAKTNVEGLHPVYDLTVEDSHEFFANGILVHNCMDAIGYFLWVYKRFDKAYTEGDFSFLAPAGLRISLPPKEDDGSPQPVRPDTFATRGALFLGHLRMMYAPDRSSSFLREAP